jgi:hypothetical protein
MVGGLSDAMSTISPMQFNWLPRPSLYAEAQAWTVRQQILRQDMDDLAAASDTFASASSDQTTGMMNLAAQAGLDRAQAAANAKVTSVLASANDPPPSASSSSLTLPDGTVIKDDPTQYLPGGSKLNLNAGTLTLSDGTVIDTATGSKKTVDVTV